MRVQIKILQQKKEGICGRYHCLVY